MQSPPSASGGSNGHRETAKPQPFAHNGSSCEERFHELMEYMQQVFYLHDARTLELLFVSDSYERIWGRTCESVLREPMSWLDAVIAEDRPEVERSLTEEAHGAVLEYRIARPDGSIRWIRSRRYPIRDDRGIIARFCGFAEDITDYKLQELELKRRTDEVEVFNQSSVSRELRMIELKAQINALSAELGRPAPYDLSGFAPETEKSNGR